MRGGVGAPSLSLNDLISAILMGDESKQFVEFIKKNECSWNIKVQAHPTI